MDDANVKVFYNPNDVDWDTIAREVNDCSRKRKMEDTAEEMANDIVEQAIKKARTHPAVIDDPFTTTGSDKAALDLVMVRSLIKDAKTTTTDMYLKESIVDFVSRKREPKKCLGDQFKLLQEHVVSRLKLDPEITWNDASPHTIKTYVREITKNKGTDLQLKTALKKAKNSLDEDCEYSWMKKALKLISVYIKHNQNGLERDQTEYNYIMSFWFPIFRRLLGDNHMFSMMWQVVMVINSEGISDFPFIGYRGEASLRASKQINDGKLDDAGRRSNGSNIDGIITHVNTGQELCIVEISGPPPKNDHTHYINDRRKIAVNLKKMFLAILQKYATSNPSTLKDLVLLGVHMYKNQLYIYSMTMPALGIFTFSTIHHVTLPNEAIHASNDLPHLTFALWSLALRLDKAANVLNSSALDYDSDGSVISLTSTPNTTPTRH
ncbi:hypothetical protein K492DRAFT_211583 [Lichtheimia hyalospora FSU 10163]|nr:hypothetical protein K492DRAFT_211583 [Lichtheimia hyalospora FSU 10163]